jgi:NADP-dependent 3-hydroxy acid dehydrogenase YdfG
LHFADSALAPNGNRALVEGNIGQASTAVTVTETAISRFGSIDAVVANAGIFFTKPFTDYTSDDFWRLSETNFEGYLCITQLAVKQMTAHDTREGIVIR